MVYWQSPSGSACARKTSFFVQAALTTEHFFAFRQCRKYLPEFDILFLIFRFAAEICSFAENSGENQKQSL